MIFANRLGLADREAFSAQTSRVAAFPFDDIRYEGGDCHDPSIVEVDGVYVMVATSGREMAPVSTSTDLLHWKRIGPIMKDPPEWLKTAVPQHRSVWAPAPLLLGKALRVYYCASQKFGSNTSFIGVAENSNFDPANPCVGWVDRGEIVESHAEKDNFNAIDPDAMVGPDGRHWMVYGSYWSGMYLLELDPKTGLKRSGATPIAVASNTGERNNPLEAPVLRYHEGYYYLYVTYGLAAQGVRSTYRMMVGRSKSPEGPFLGFDGKPMTDGGHTDVLKSTPPMFGPGGGNVFQDKKGEWWFAYHYYDSTRHWHGDVWGKPTLQVRRVVWADGWPLPGLPAGVELAYPAHLSVVGNWTYQSDFGEVFSLDLEAKGTAITPHGNGHWTIDGNQLTLHWPIVEGTTEERTEKLELDETHQFFVGRNQAGAVVRGIRADAQIRQL